MKNLASLLCFLLSFQCFAQIDDIALEIKKLDEFEGIEKSDQLHEIAAYYYDQNWDSVKVYAEQQYKLAKQIDYNLGLVQAMVDLGNVSDIKGKFDESRKLYLDALDIDLDDNTIHIDIYKGLGNLYFYNDSYDSSIIYFDKSIDLANSKFKTDAAKKLILNKAVALNSSGKFKEAIEILLGEIEYFKDKGDIKSLHIINTDIGNAYTYLNDFDQAEKYYKIALDYALAIDKNNTLGMSYGNLANTYGAKQQFDSSEMYFIKASESFKDAGLVMQEIYAKTNLLNLYVIKNEQGKALDLIKELEQEKLAPEPMANVLYNKGRILFDQGKYKEAQQALDQTIEIGKNINSQTSLLKAYTTSIKNYLYLKSPKVLDYYIQYDSILNNRFDKDNKEIISELNKKYETKEKEAQIATQKLENEKQKLYKYSAFGGIGVLLLLGGGVYAYNQERQKKKIIQKQNELQELQYNMTKLGLSNLNNQINTHDIKNTLTAALNEVQKKAPKSYQHISNLLSITESALYSDSFTDSLRNQFSQIEGLVELSKPQLFEEVELEIENELEPDVQVPRLLLKNLVENSLKHGIKGTNQNGKIEVKTYERNNFIYIEVKDSGKGIESKNLSRGKGISVYRELFNYFNHKNDNHAKMEVRNVDNGTLASIQIPTNYQYT